MPTTDKPVYPQREDGEQDQRRRGILERAKARASAGGDRPKALENVPRFDEVHAAGKTMKPAPGHSTPPPGLSKGTAAALDAVEEANRSRPVEPSQEAEAVAPAGPAAPLDRDDIAELFGVTPAVAREIFSLAYPAEDDNISLRRRVEKRLPALDIGEFLMNGSATQAVPIIPVTDTVRKGLTITYQSVTEAVEASVDYHLSTEAAKIRKERGEGDKFIDVEMSQREYVRRQNEYALAVHIAAYGDQKWPALLSANGTVDEPALALRLTKVRQIPSALFGMAIQNLSWFLDRVQRTLEVAVLGNG
jgi:hypothetical protein